MRPNPPRITLKELRPIMEYYHSEFPTWRVVNEDTLVREVSPILQGIAFERLSGGDYRPIGHIRVLVAPRSFWSFELSQDLNIKLRTIERRRHPLVKAQVVDAMRAEFLPRMDEPLVAEDVLDLYEREAHPTRAEAYSLAPFNAYLGHYDQAKYWCARYKKLMANLGKQKLSEEDIARQAFLDQLERWLDAEDANPQLEGVLQEQRHKWGLA